MAINFPTSLDTFTVRSSGQTISEDHMNDVQDAVEALEIKMGIDGSAVTSSHDYLIENLIPGGTKMLFYADAAPAGWTIENTLDDKLVFVTKGSVAGGDTGGQAHATGTWTQPNHQLVASEIPAHTHPGSTAANESAHTHDSTTHTGTGSAQEGATTGNVSNPETTGAGSAHTHTITVASQGGDGNHNHGTTWRPAAYNCIICSKD
jgi:hypothetical protein